MSSGHTTSRALRTRRRAAVNGGVAEQATGGGALPRSRMDVRRTSRLRTPSPQVPTRPLPPAHPVSAVGRPPRGATCRDRSSRTQQADHRHQRGPVRTSAQSTTPRNVVNRGHHRAACSGAEEVVNFARSSSAPRGRLWWPRGLSTARSSCCQRFPTLTRAGEDMDHLASRPPRR